MNNQILDKYLKHICVLNLLNKKVDFYIREYQQRLLIGEKHIIDHPKSTQKKMKKLKNIAGLGKKSSKTKSIDMDVQNRMHTVDRKASQRGGDYGSRHGGSIDSGASGGISGSGLQSLASMQQDYVSARLQRGTEDPTAVYQKRSLRSDQAPHQEENMMLDSYQSVHADKFRQGRGPTDEDFSMVSRPHGDAEREAYKNAKYQDRVRIERANRSNTSGVINPGAVDSSHRQSTLNKKRQEHQRQSISSGVIDDKGLAQRDHFDLINADKNYMDDQVDQGVAGSIDAFFNDVTAMRENHDDTKKGGKREPRRSTAFNEVIENPYGEESMKNKKLAAAGGGGAYAQAVKNKKFGFGQDIKGGKATKMVVPDVGDEMAFTEQQFGEIDEDDDADDRDSGLKFSLTDKLRKRYSGTDSGALTTPDPKQAEDPEDAAELADRVPDMPGTDLFDRSQTRTQNGGSKRFASVTTGDEFYKGQARAKLGLHQQRTEEPKSKQPKDMDAAEFRRRGLSFVKLQRNRARHGGANQETDSTEGNAKNQDPRLFAYKERAMSVVDTFLHANAEDQKADAEKQNQVRLAAEKELKADIQKYRRMLDADPDDDEVSKRFKAEMIQDLAKENVHIDNNSNNQLEDLKATEAQQKQFLEDFYKQMNVDAEAEFDKELDEREAQRVGEQASEGADSQHQLSTQDQISQRRHQTFYDHLREDFTKESIDMIRFIDWNERRHRVDAQQCLKQNSQIARRSLIAEATLQHRLTEETHLGEISAKLAFERQYNNCAATCIALSDELILIGNSNGELCMYDRETQEPYAIFAEKGKDFQGNAVSSLDVHPTRPEYVLIGYQFGQLVLLDVTAPEKALRVIKDHHKGATVVNVAFCDWIKGSQAQEKQKAGAQQPPQKAGQLSYALVTAPAGSSGSNPYEDGGIGAAGESPYIQQQKAAADHQAWMFVSVDSLGRVVLTAVSKVMFMFKSTKQLLIEPRKNESKFYSIAARFKSDLHPQMKLNDCVTLVAVASSDRVLIMAVNQTKCQVLREMERPKYLSMLGNQSKELLNCQPSMCWGFAHSPVFKDKCYSTLAVGWGPLIQVYVLNDVMDPDACFFEDGHHILTPEGDAAGATSSQASKLQEQSTSASQDAGDLGDINPFTQGAQFAAVSARQSNLESGQTMSPFEMCDLYIEKICFLSESILLVLTRTLEFKLFYTQKLDHGPYTEAKSVNKAGSAASRNQGGADEDGELLGRRKYEGAAARKNHVCQIDGAMYASNICESQHGQLYNQTLRVFNGMVVALGLQGVLQYLHLRWDESLQEYKKIVQGNWIQLFARAIDIYTGKVKGFKDVPEEQLLRQESMKAELKLLIRTIITQQMDTWAAERAQSAARTTRPQPVKKKKVKKAAPVPAKAPAVENDNPYDNPYAQAAPRQQPVAQVAQEEEEYDEEEADNLAILDDLETLDKQEKSKEMAERYRTLIRIAIEFCVTIQDCYFLFYDLFLMFQEESLENIFLDELKPFIMAGRFQDWDLPNDILQNHIINYYKDPAHPELLEKIIINLSLKECPKSVLMELTEFCQEHFLSTALLYLHTAVHDPLEEALCVPVILSLLALYRQAKRTNPGTLEEIRCIKDLSPDSMERLKAEKSQIYLGFKVLWAIRLFLNGKKFPQGNIPTKLWRSYVFELVDCISQSQVMLDLLYIDSEAYFQIVSIIFYKGQVFDFIKQGKLQQKRAIQAQQAQVANPIISQEIYEELMPQLSHKELLERFDAVCQSKEEDGYVVPDEIRLQYLFFVANVPSSNNADIQKEPQYYFQCMTELLKQSQKFLRFNKNLMQRAMTRKGRMRYQGSIATSKALEDQHIFAGENSLVDLLKLCEPLQPDQLEQLLALTEYTRFNHLRVKLLEKKGDYVQCLQLFVEGMRFRDSSSHESALRVFDFIRERLNEFQQANQGKGVPGGGRGASAKSADLEKQFRSQIIGSFPELVKIDAMLSFKLVDEAFSQQQQEIIESISGHAEQQFQYLDTMFTHHHDKIQSLIEKHLMSALESPEDSAKAEEYMSLQKLHFRLLCQVSPAGVIDRVRQIKRNEVKLAPVDCLDICEKYQQIEACAMLSHRMSSYLASVTYYMRLATEKEHFDFPLLIKQLSDVVQSGGTIPHFIPYLAKQDTKRHKLIMKAAAHGRDAKGRLPIGTRHLQKEDLQVSQIIRFDYIIRKAMKICGKESKENQNFDNVDKTWFYVLESMFKIKLEQTRLLTKIKEQNLSSLAQLNPRQQSELASGASQPGDIIRSMAQKYETHIENFEEFFKSRLNFVIETSLNHIELKAFLERLVGHDEDIKFAELGEMIRTIFSEVSSEALVLANAKRTARRQITAAFEGCGLGKTTGILFRYRQCNKCNRFLDEEIKDKKKKQELMSYARRGTFISSSMVGGFENDSDDEYEDADQAGFYAGEKMRLYDCGHAFHIQCIVRHARERVEQKAQQQMGGPGRAGKASKAPAQVTRKMLEEQRCPWCYSEKYQIDIEPTLKKQSARKGNGTFANRFNKQFGFGSGDGASLEGSSDASGDDDLLAENDFRADHHRMAKRAQVSGSVVKRQQKSVLEQRLGQFDHAVENEGVTSDNFKLQVM